MPIRWTAFRMMPSLENHLKRFRGAIEQMIGGTYLFALQSESSLVVQVERGIIFPRALMVKASDPELLQLASTVMPLGMSCVSRMSVVNRLGHRQPAYTGLMVYSWVRAFHVLRDMLSDEDRGRWQSSICQWCDMLHVELHDTHWPDPEIPASLGADATRAAWSALALTAAGDVFHQVAWSTTGGDMLHSVIRGQTPAGAFLKAKPADNLESYWYHELAILHAVASHAMQWSDKAMLGAARQAARFHCRETQPDHATNEPWGLSAFMLDEQTCSLADQILHTVSMQFPAGAEGVASLLLADVLYCLRLSKVTNLGTQHEQHADQFN